MVKKTIIEMTLIIVVLFSNSVLADDVQDVKESLNEYYFAFIMEDMDSYLDHSFILHLSDDELEQKVTVIEEMWNKFDSGFAIDGPIDVIIDGATAVAEYKLSATIFEGEESFHYEEPFIAILFNDGRWKVFQAMPRAQFDFNMNIDMMKLDDYNETPEKPPVIEEAKGCMPDLSHLDTLNQSYANYPMVKQLLGDDKVVHIKIGDMNYFVMLEGQKAFLIENTADVDFVVTIDQCAFDRIINGGNPKTEYDVGNIKIESKNFGDSIKLGIMNFLNSIYKLFKKEPFEMFIEAETGILENKGPYTFIGATSRGPGELYLGDGGASSTYVFESDYAGDVNIYLWVSDDAMHRDGARNVIFNVNGLDISYNHRSVNYIEPGKFWGKEELGVATIKKGENKIVITKPKTTSAAFVMDKMMLIE